MSSKIKVDPRTFKIINQEKSIESKIESTLTSESESDSGTSINSDTDSVKVIKLDDSLQSGGKEKPQFQTQFQPQSQPQKPQFQQQKPQIESTIKTTSFNPINNLSSQPLPPLKEEQKNMEENYLRTTNPSIISVQQSNIPEEVSGTDTKTDSVEVSGTDSGTESEIKENPKVEENGSTDIIDLTKSQLHDVLFSIFADSKGNNISENIEKMSKLFEAHNQIMDKILNQLIIMNSNYKQVTVPEVVQKNTKQSTSLNEFRKNIKETKEFVQNNTN